MVVLSCMNPGLSMFAVDNEQAATYQWRSFRNQNDGDDDDDDDDNGIDVAPAA